MLSGMPLVFDIHLPWGLGFHPHACASLYVCPSVCHRPSQNVKVLVKVLVKVFVSAFYLENAFRYASGI